MLQNRVDPFGNIFATAARGLWMGNRGVIHNESKMITRHFRNKAWIICKLEFKGRKRTLMSPGRWTELFFLDEATAFAAGHRPCFECRRDDALKFKTCWINGNPKYHLQMTSSIQKIDEILHAERIHRTKEIVGDIHQLPDGTVVEENGEAYLICAGALYRWTPFGYEKRSHDYKASPFVLVTPKSIVNAFGSGYIPQISCQSHCCDKIPNKP